MIFQVLGIYTFTKRVNVDDFEAKPRKTQGYSTVSHFNIVHVDCHLAAVRYAMHNLTSFDLFHARHSLLDLFPHVINVNSSLAYWF